MQNRSVQYFGSYYRFPQTYSADCWQRKDGGTSDPVQSLSCDADHAAYS